MTQAWCLRTGKTPTVHSRSPGFQVIAQPGTKLPFMVSQVFNITILSRRPNLNTLAMLVLIFYIHANFFFKKSNHCIFFSIFSTSAAFPASIEIPRFSLNLRTMPPASCTIKAPAHISQGCNANSQYPSNQPAATQHKS